MEQNGAGRAMKSARYACGGWGSLAEKVAVEQNPESSKGGRYDKIGRAFLAEGIGSANVP